MKERIEDLGRLLAILGHIYEMDVFEALDDRAKYATEHFFSLSQEVQSDLIHSLA